MIVERNTVPVKFGKAKEYIEVERKVKHWYDERNITVRLHTAYYGKYDVVVIEKEFESLAANEKFPTEIISTK